MRHSESFAKIAAALVKAQGEMSAVAKDSTNPHFKSKYTKLDTIVETIRPILATNGLGVMQGAACADGKTLTVETMLVHDSGEWIASDVVVPMVKLDPQGAGGALTYGRRYGLSALLNIVSDEDDDGNSASRPNASARNAAPSRLTNGSGEQRAHPTPSGPNTNASSVTAPTSPNATAVRPTATEPPAIPLKLNSRYMTSMSNEELETLIADKATDPKYAKHIVEARRILATRTPEAKFAAEEAYQKTLPIPA